MDDDKQMAYGSGGITVDSCARGFDMATVISPDGTVRVQLVGYHMTRSPDNRFMICEDFLPSLASL